MRSPFNKHTVDHFVVYALMTAAGLLSYHYHNLDASDVYMPLLTAAATGTMIWAMAYEEKDLVGTRAKPERLDGYVLSAAATVLLCWGGSRLPGAGTGVLVAVSINFIMDALIADTESMIWATALDNIVLCCVLGTKAALPSYSEDAAPCGGDNTDKTATKESYVLYTIVPPLVYFVCVTLATTVRHANSAHVEQQKKTNPKTDGKGSPNPSWQLVSEGAKYPWAYTMGYYWSATDFDKGAEDAVILYTVAVELAPHIIANDDLWVKVAALLMLVWAGPALQKFFLPAVEKLLSPLRGMIVSLMGEYEPVLPAPVTAPAHALQSDQLRNVLQF